MEVDNLKSAWQEISTPPKGKEELNQMLKKNSHPILAAIKKQIKVELLGFTVFLFCYFTMFDGTKKPMYINIIVIAVIILQLYYGYKGYIMQRVFKSNTNLNQDLLNFTNQLKSYRTEVTISRVLFTIGFLAFFTYNINFSESKWLALASILLAFAFQFFFLYKIWTKRIDRLELVLQEFSTSAH